jgi:serine/threonine protein phosphatase PrpC
MTGKFSTKLKTLGRKLAGKKGADGGQAVSPEAAAAFKSGAPGTPKGEPQNLRLSMDAMGAMGSATAQKYGQSPKSPKSPEAPEALPGEAAEGSRRLSIDGDMIAKVKQAQQSIKPDKKSPMMDTSPVSTGTNAFSDEDAASDDADDGTEKRIDVDVDEVGIPVVLGGNSRAGWSKSPASGGNPAEPGVRKANQDSYGAFAPFGQSRGQAFVCVFDGHGAEGRPSSQVVRDNVPRAVLRCLRDGAADVADGETEPPMTEKSQLVRRFLALRTAFEEAEEVLKDEDSEIDHVFSGTTAVATLICGQFVFTAWAGDSRAVVGRGQGASVYPVDLSHDQKPSRTDEKKRVRALGGRVTRWKKNIGPLRVWLPDDWIPGLAMTRSVGDTVLTEYGVVPTPEVTVCELSPKDQFIILASDGVWEFMSSGEVVTFVARLKATGAPPSTVANALVAESVRRWKANEQVVDDTTAVIVYTNFTEKGSSGLERPQQLLENGDLTPFSPRNDEDKASTSP